MKIQNILGFVILLALAMGANAADDQNTIIQKTNGDAILAKVVVDSAPGSISAMGLLGVAGDQTTVIENPRNLTVALKAFDGQNAFGLSLTPARTSLLPLNISTYNDNAVARIWAGTTISYAQGRADVSSKSYNRRAIAIETSYYFDPHKDDPFVMYWDALAAAGKTPNDDKNPCVLIPAQPPGSPEGDELKKALDKRAQDCRDKVAKGARWNASRFWASVATGQYESVTGGASHSLGNTAVLGATWGIGDAGAQTSAALTLAAKRISGSPVLSTFSDATPTRQSSTLVTFRAAVGSEHIRALLEASNVKNQAPTALDRTFKQAFGLDLNVAEGCWINLRVGKQRRIDNSGDETGSTFSLSYSPKALLNF